jgi:antirestriction protein ArdC
MSADLYRDVTNRIVAALAAGTPPWVRPWSTITDAFPINAASKRPYRGVNFTLLSLETQAHGYPLNRFLTYKQAADLGAQVRRRERGSTVVYWKLRQVGATGDTYPTAHEEDLPERVIPLLRAFTVFNVAQIDNLPAEPH